jgi:hypothetical protein
LIIPILDSIAFDYRLDTRQSRLLHCLPELRKQTINRTSIKPGDLE